MNELVTIYNSLSFIGQLGFWVVLIIVVVIAARLGLLGFLFSIFGGDGKNKFGGFGGGSVSGGGASGDF